MAKQARAKIQQRKQKSTEWNIGQPLDFPRKQNPLIVTKKRPAKRSRKTLVSFLFDYARSRELNREHSASRFILCNRFYYSKVLVGQSAVLTGSSGDGLLAVNNKKWFRKALPSYGAAKIELGTENGVRVDASSNPWARKVSLGFSPNSAR